MAKTNRKRPSKRPATKTSKKKKLSLDGFIEELPSDAGNNNPDNKTVRLIAKSANSKSVQSIWSRLEALQTSGVKVLAIFANLGTRKKDKEVLHRYAEVFGTDTAAENIRAARFRKSSILNEQVQLGEKGAWHEGPKSSDDSVTVDVDENSISAARVAFEMTWAVSDKIEKQQIEKKPKRTLGWGRKKKTKK